MRALRERLMGMVDKTEACWLFTGDVTEYGYGRMRITDERGRRHVPAHRISYEVHVGPIPEGLVIDHLCRVRHCVRPDHLEPVTQRVNILRGVAPAAINAALTHCKKAGHPLTADNLSHDTPGHRRCKTCRAEYERERNKRRYPAIKAARAAKRAERKAAA